MMEMSPEAKRIVEEVEAMDRAELLASNEEFLAKGDAEYLRLAVEGYRAMADLLPVWATPRDTFLRVAEKLEKRLEEMKDGED